VLQHTPSGRVCRERDFIWSYQAPIAESASPRNETPLTDHPAAPPTPTLAGRPPAASVIAECLRTQAQAPPRSAVARLFGRSPLTPASLPWYVGALGELEVARRLDSLGPEWRVFHAVPVGNDSSDIDHVVIGPPGAFTINTKHHAGKDVWVGGKRMLVSGQRTDYLRNSMYEAKRASQRLSVAMGALVDVAPVIVIVGARRFTVRERPATVFVLREHELARWLTRLPAVVPPVDVARLADAAAVPSTWHRDPVLEPVDLTPFLALRDDVVRARSRRRGWVLAFALAAPAAYFATFGSFLSLLAR
jgi:Nuclease-related domain